MRYGKDKDGFQLSPPLDETIPGRLASLSHGARGHAWLWFTDQEHSSPPLASSALNVATRRFPASHVRCCRRIQPCGNPAHHNMAWKLMPLSGLRCPDRNVVGLSDKEISMDGTIPSPSATCCRPGNKGKMIGPPLRPGHVWAMHLDIARPRPGDVQSSHRKHPPRLRPHGRARR